MNKSIKKYFTKKIFSEFICPTCNNKLTFLEKEFIQYNTRKTEQLLNSDHYDELDLEKKFVGFLKCNKCGEKITIIGNVFLEPDNDYDETDGTCSTIYYPIYEPLFFNPPVLLFNIPENCPLQIKKILLDSFNLFWSDYSAASNKIRSLLDKLLDNLKIRKTKITKNHKRKKLTLHERILLLKETSNKEYRELADILLAIKWLGNEGSHNTSITFETIYKTFEILELAIKKLYDNTEKILLKEVKKINKKKKK
jgi:hypothetical protein